MVARAQLIDISPGFTPLLKSIYPKTLVATLDEDKGIKSLPVAIAEGANFLPTITGWFPVGYREASLAFPPLPPAYGFQQYVQDIICYGTQDTPLRLVALTATGAYAKDPFVGTWEPVLDSEDFSAIAKPWSWCVVGDVLYFSNGHNNRIYKIDKAATTFFEPSFVTTFEGVFKAGTRIGVWDSSGTIFWSAAEDHTDFEPSLTSLAGYAQFEGVVGHIKTVLSHGEGFIIYTDTSIVGARFLPTSDLVWDAQVILPNTGILVSKCVCQGVKDTEHYAWTPQGLYKIQMYAYEGTTHPAELLKPEIQDYLLDADIVYPSFVGDRYLTLSFTKARESF